MKHKNLSAGRNAVKPALSTDGTVNRAIFVEGRFARWIETLVDPVTLVEENSRFLLKKRGKKNPKCRARFEFITLFIIAKQWKH